MSPSLPEEELGGDPPCWAARFEEAGEEPGAADAPGDGRDADEGPGPEA
jgi:hypothetical protein